MADVPSGMPSPFDPTGFTHVQRGVEDPNETRPHADTPPPAGDSRPPSSMRPLSVGRTVGKYEIQAEIGEGGMGRVYRAYDPELKRHVAIKMLRPSTGIDDVSRFRGEAALVAALEHPNIVQIYEIDNDTDGRPFLVLEYVDGGGLDTKIHQRLPRPREAAEWLETLALAVQAAHDRGIIHRDLKPANVLVTRTGTLKVSDFGLGKRLDESSGRTQTGDVFGTPGYMAPEQASGKVKQFGPQTDVYALGAMLYEFLTGRPPFTGAKVWEIISQVQYADPVAPSVVARGIPRDLNTICLKCLEKAPGRRYQTAKELADDLRRYLDGMHILASPVPWWGKLWRQAKRRPKETAIIATMTSATIVIGWLVLANRDRDRAMAERARIQLMEDDNNRRLMETEAANRRDLLKRNDEALTALRGIRTAVLGEDLSRPEVKAKLKQQLGTYFRTVVQSGGEVQQGDVAALTRLADECRTTGQLFGEGGQSADAADLYSQAAKLYERAVGLNGGPAAVSSQAVCLREAGRYQTTLHRYAEAIANLNAAERLLDRVNPVEAAEVFHRKGELFVEQERFAEADAAFSKAIALLTGVPKGTQPAAETARLRALARGYGWRGDVRLQLGTDLETSADADYWESDRLRGEVVQLLTGVSPDLIHREKEKLKDEAVGDAVFNMCYGWGNHASFALRKRMFGTARHFIHKQTELLTALTTHRPGRAEYQTALAGLYLNLSEIELAVGDFTPTVEQANRAAELATTAARTYKELADANAETITIRTNWARCLLVQARAEVIRGGDPRPLLDQIAVKIGEPRPDERMIDQYARAALHGLRAATSANPAEQTDAAVKLLRTAVKEKGFREMHRETMRSDVAFRTVRTAPGFEDVFTNTVQRLTIK